MPQGPGASSLDLSPQWMRDPDLEEPMPWRTQIRERNHMVSDPRGRSINDDFRHDPEERRFRVEAVLDQSGGTEQNRQGQCLQSSREPSGVALDRISEGRTADRQNPCHDHANHTFKGQSQQEKTATKKGERGDQNAVGQRTILMEAVNQSCKQVNAEGRSNKQAPSVGNCNRSRQPDQR